MVASSPIRPPTGDIGVGLIEVAGLSSAIDGLGELPACVSHLVAKRRYSRSTEELERLRDQFNANHLKFNHGELIETTFALTKAMSDNNNSFLLQIGWMPTYEIGWEDMQVQLYFYRENRFREVVLSKVLDFFELHKAPSEILPDRKIKVHEGHVMFAGILSHVVRELQGVDTLLSPIPRNLKRYSKCGAATRRQAA